MISTDELLYHYTTLDAFLSIASKRKLWASHIRYLNDTSEQTLMRELLLRRIEAKLQSTAADNDRARLEEARMQLRTAQDESIYVAAFSRDGGDRLSQWRGYSGAAGVSIGFAPKKMERLCNAFTTAWNAPGRSSGAAMLRKVTYLTDPAPGLYQVIDSIIERVVSGQDEGRGISIRAAGLKHASFEEEHEWRITLFDLRGGPPPQVRSRKGMLIPYYEFDLGSPLWPAVPSVVVGPSAHLKENMSAVRDIVGPNVEVRASAIPYRDW